MNLGRPWRALAAACCLAGALQAQVQTFQLPSGLRCVLLEKHDQPLIRLELVTRWDPAEEPAGREGLAGFLAALLRAGGAGPYSLAEFNRAQDDLGLTFAFASRRNVFRWTLATDSRNQEPALELLADAVFRPVLEPALVEAQRPALARQWAGLSAWETTRARFLWSLGDPATELPPNWAPLASVSFGEVEAFWRRVVRPESSTLILHGDLSLAQAKELVHLHFGLWGPGPRSPGGAAAEPAPGRKVLVDLGSGGDAELWAGRRPFTGPAAVGELLALLLEQVPAVVGPGIIRTCSLEPGAPFLVKLRAGPSGRAGLVAAFQETLATLRQGFTPVEVDRARRRWQARMTALPLHPQDLVHSYQEGTLDPALQGQVAAVGVQELNAALAALLDAESLRYLVLGADDRLVRAADQAFGPVKP